MSHDGPYSNDRYLLHLFACSLNGELPHEIPEDCSWEAVFRLASQNGVQGLLWEAVKRLNTVPDELRTAWEDVATSILIRNIQLDADRAEIVSRLSGAGISYLTLKGAALLPLYPSPSMRTMSDNDILFGFVEPDGNGGFRVRGASERERAASQEEAGRIVRNVMRDMGYTVFEHSGDVCDIQFSKAPYYRYEMHFALMEKHRPYYFYFENPWKRAIPIGDETPGAGREFRFSDEDQYIYMIVHAYKHENLGGEGIRILSDIAIALRAAGESFDVSYVEKELSRMDLLDFERSLRELTFALLYGKGLNIHLEELAMRMVACGQGSVERFVKAKIAEESKAGRWGRFGYLRKLCSPDYYCPGELEFLANNRILRPLFPIGRIVLFISNAMRAPQNQLRKVLALLKGK